LEDPAVTLRTARARRDLSQREVGQQLGVHGKTVERWEKGEPLRGINPRQLVLLADWLAVDPGQFARAILAWYPGPEPEPPATVTVDRAKLDAALPGWEQLLTRKEE
jgi:transcriptional regulator with XRE-family HTH domain